MHNHPFLFVKRQQFCPVAFNMVKNLTEYGIAYFKKVS